MSIDIAPTTADLLGLFPPGTRLDDDGTLMVGGCRLDDVAAQFGTPAIVVSEDALRQRARDYLAAFRDRWPRCDLAFASKSCPCTAVQRVMTEEGLHLDVAGGGEILTALKAGADPARLVLHGNAKTDEELEMLDGAFHVDERSRLCCQIIMAPELDGLEVELAPESVADAPVQRLAVGT